MKIAIDGIFMVNSQSGGYKTYTTNLVHALAQLREVHDFRLLVDQPTSLTLPPNWRIVSLPRTGSLGFIWREQVALPRYLTSQGADILHAPGATGPLRTSVPLLVTLYDTIEFSEPLPSPRQAKHWGMRLYSRYVQRRAAQHAYHIVTISHHSKRQIANFFSLPDDRITVIHLAPSPIFLAQDERRAREETGRRWSVSDHVLGIASAARRKNVGALLHAYALLPESVRHHHPLVLVCTHPGVKAQVSTLARQSGLSDQVRLLENVSDSDLALLYSAASVFVFPSLEEGFGLPPLEAMACGVPVVASNTSSIPEVVGEAGILVTPTDVAEIAEAINRVLTTPGVAEDLRARGFARSASFSWSKVAQQTVAVYGLIAQT